MRNMSKVFTEAHRITRDMVEEYGMDYRAQFAITLSYLLNKKEEEEVRELKGTEKQVKWANDIMAIFDEIVADVEISIEKYSKTEERKEIERNKLKDIKLKLDELEDAGQIINNYKKLSYMDEMSRLHEVRRIFKDEFGIGFGIRSFQYAEEMVHERYA